MVGSWGIWPVVVGQREVTERGVPPLGVVAKDRSIGAAYEAEAGGASDFARADWCSEPGSQRCAVPHLGDRQAPRSSTRSVGTPGDGVLRPGDATLKRLGLAIPRAIERRSARPVNPVDPDGGDVHAAM